MFKLQILFESNFNFFKSGSDIEQPRSTQNINIFFYRCNKTEVKQVVNTRTMLDVNTLNIMPNVAGMSNEGFNRTYNCNTTRISIVE
ncbi:hypothetical protein HanPI659440_Chr01g0016831 [Helianthus annuus]|nr:hypothetical protein HanPI659440_Chr01g0016831 [Helianthus annuus]